MPQLSSFAAALKVYIRLTIKNLLGQRSFVRSSVVSGHSLKGISRILTSKLDPEALRSWAPFDYKLSKYFYSSPYTYIDDPSLGIGDSLFRLAYLHTSNVTINDRIYLEPRAFATFQSLIKLYNINYAYDVQPLWLLSQRNKSLIISSGLIGSFYRFLFSVFTLSQPSPRSLAEVHVEDGLANSSVNQSIFLWQGTISSQPKQKNILLTFHCARKDSYLTPSHLLAVCKYYNRISLLQHFPSKPCQGDYLSGLNQPTLSNENYFGSNPLKQILTISDSSLLISVASSCAKFAIILCKPLLLLLFPSHNSSFYQYYENRSYLAEEKEYVLYQINPTFLIVKFKSDNSSLSSNTLLRALDHSLKYMGFEL